MLEARLLVYLKALNLEPLWLMKDKDVVFTNNVNPSPIASNKCSKTVDTREFPVPVDDSISTPQHLEPVSRSDSIHLLPTTPSSLQKNYPSIDSKVAKQKTSETLNKKKIALQLNLGNADTGSLELLTRSQFMTGQKNQTTLLLGFLASHLNQTVSPLSQPAYARLLKDLFKHIGLHSLSTFNHHATSAQNNLVIFPAIKGAILFSRAFEFSIFQQFLQKENIPTLVTEHPLSFLRNPILKKQLWEDINRLFNALD
ncbi:MAG: hypothetical protein WDW20_04620 [Neisseriaceae bacterium]